MTALGFSPSFHSMELQDVDVPVEVLSPLLKVVAKSTSSQIIDVEPGKYFVSAVLPAGRQLGGWVTVGDTPVFAELLPDPGDEPPADESLERKHFLTPPPQPRDVTETRTSVLETLGPSREALAVPVEMPVALRQFFGNVFRGDVFDADEVTVQPKDGMPILRHPNGPLGPAYVQMTQTGSVPMTLAVPWGQGPMNEVLFRQDGSYWTLDFHLANPTGNLLLCYRANGYVQQAAEATLSPSLSAEELLQGKMNDPIAAAVGAYALLRFADLDRMHDWTENLRVWFDWLPDGSAIRGEHLARLGEHTLALAAFIELLDRGLPMFTDGFAFALDRLRTYLSSDIEATAAQRSAAEALLEKLKRIAPAVDDGSPVLVIAGDPLELLARSPNTSEPAAAPEAAAYEEQSVGA